MRETGYEELAVAGGVPIKAWVRGVDFDAAARAQLENVARLDIVHGWVAAMPDVHWGLGATVGSVIPCRRAVIPAAVGVDIGCGMLAARTTLAARDLPDDLGPLRARIERAVPHGRSVGRGRRDVGSWHDAPAAARDAWGELAPGFERIAAKRPEVERANTLAHLGTLGTGNHFIELCLDGAERLWILLHSGSRGVGNRIGQVFIELAKRDMGSALGRLPDVELAYLKEGTRHFDDYVEAVEWAQRFARANRALMLRAVLAALAAAPGLPAFAVDEQIVDCHHNYVSREHHAGADVYVTRKGAVRARAGELGIIPGSMGARSYIVRGKGSPDSFESCSHGAGRALSRTQAKRAFTLDDHRAATAHVECRKDAGVLDETPAAYKPIDRVMAAQRDLIEVLHELTQVVCVKG